MLRTLRVFGAFCMLAVVSLPAKEPLKKQTFAARAVNTKRNASIWRGSGTPALVQPPTGPYTFVREDRGGTSPKFEIGDGEGTEWKVKLGEEAKPETAAARLLAAAGYYTDEDYYLPELRVEKMPKLRRGQPFVAAGGVIHGARLERKVKGKKRSGNWSWFDNPMKGTKEMDGLRVLMALINNWDLKQVNNDIYEETGEPERYVVSDLGATFGRTGNSFVRSKSNLADYRRSKFVQKVEAEHVDFHMNSRPFVLSVFHLPNYIQRTRMQKIVKHIPRGHAQWVGRQLAQLSPAQIRECFRSAGYAAEEVEAYAQVVEGRIAELQRL
jgi:hypothetical protein